MKYIRIQYKNSAGIITFGEYVKEQQPRIYIQLLKFVKTKKKKIDVTEKVLFAADVSGKDNYYKYIMQERPKGGRGGLLPWEKEEDLW